jgi:hypothetical protein
LLDSIQELLAHTPKKGVRFFRYVVDKSRLDGFRADMPVLRVVFEERVFFDTDKSVIRSEALPVLGVIADSLRHQKGQVALFVAGHADSRGSDEYNLSLSIRRAEAVARALNESDVRPAVIWRVGFGKAVPLRPNTSAQNMAYNRRVEFLIASQPAVITAWVKGTQTLCERQGVNCGEPTTPKRFEALPMEETGAKPIVVEVPARPLLASPTNSPTMRPALPQVVPERPSIRELAPHNEEQRDAQ